MVVVTKLLKRRKLRRYMMKTMTALILVRRARRRLADLRLNAEGPTKKKSIWIKPWLQKRSTQGAFENLITEFPNEDPVAYKNFLRMDKASFDKVLDCIRPIIEKKNTRLRECISVSERLCHIFVWWLYLCYTHNLRQDIMWKEDKIFGLNFFISHLNSLICYVP